MAKFFIDRPVFAIVVAIVMLLAGTIAGLSLPIAQFPQITLPTIRVAATYPGANAEVVEQAVAQPIEEQVNGVEGMQYMNATAAGSHFQLRRDIENVRRQALDAGEFVVHVGWQGQKAGDGRE